MSWAPLRVWWDQRYEETIPDGAAAELLGLVGVPSAGSQGSVGWERREE